MCDGGGGGGSLAIDTRLIYEANGVDSDSERWPRDARHEAAAYGGRGRLRASSVSIPNDNMLLSRRRRSRRSSTSLPCRREPTAFWDRQIGRACRRSRRRSIATPAPQTAMPLPLLLGWQWRRAVGDN